MGRTAAAAQLPGRAQRLDGDLTGWAGWRAAGCGPITEQNASRRKRLNAPHSTVNSSSSTRQLAQNVQMHNKREWRPHLKAGSTMQRHHLNHFCPLEGGPSRLWLSDCDSWTIFLSISNCSRHHAFNRLSHGLNPLRCQQLLSTVCHLKNTEGLADCGCVKRLHVVDYVERRWYTCERVKPTFRDGRNRHAHTGGGR